MILIASACGRADRDVAVERDLGVRVEHQAPGSFDMVEMNNLIDAAVASRPNGLVVSIPDPDAVVSAIRTALDAGLPVISINSGADVYRELLEPVGVDTSEFSA